ncbi:hypothetical protein QFZ89_008312 [Paraburkholderia youngii]
MASKKILMLLIAAWLDVYNGPISAQTLNTQFLGWIGKSQHGYSLGRIGLALLFRWLWRKLWNRGVNDRPFVMPHHQL